MDANNIAAFDWAIKTGSTALFDELAKDFASFSQEDKDTLFLRTVINAPTTVFIQHVLDYGMSIDRRTSNDATWLHYAAMSDYPDTVRFFIEKGLNVNEMDESGNTPIVYAAEFSGNVDVLKALLDAGADKCAKRNHSESLLITSASRNRNPDITRFLIEQNFDLEARDNDGLTPLLSAAAHQTNGEVLELLVDAGANIHAKANDGATLFHIAACNTSLPVVRYIASAFSTTDCDENGFTCLERALLSAESGDVVKLYLRKMKEEHIACAAMNPAPDILETLIQSGYDVNLCTNDGVTPLHLVARLNNNPSVVRMLRYYNAIWNVTDRQGRTALHYAAANRDGTLYGWMLNDDDFKTLSAIKDAEGNTPEYYLSHKDDF